MTRSVKFGLIFFCSTSGLLFMRILFSFIALSDNLLNWMFSLLMQGVFLGLVPYLLYRALFRGEKSFLADCRVRPKVHPLSYLIAFVLGLLCFVINMAVSTLWYILMQTAGYTYSSSVGTIFSSPEVLIFEILFTAVMPALFEELVDRGVLLAALDDLPGDKIKILIIGIGFGLVHQNAPQLVPTMVGGLIMAYMAVKSDSIVPGMIVHFLNNFLVILVDFGDQKGNIIGKIYHAFWEFYAQNLLVMLAIAAVLTAATVGLLKVFAKINLPYRKQRPAALSIPSADAEFERIYRMSAGRPMPHDTPEAASYVTTIGYDGFVRRVPRPDMAVPQTQQPPLPQAKRGSGDYVFVVLAFAMTAVTTVITYFWGVLR